MNKKTDKTIPKHWKKLKIGNFIKLQGGNAFKAKEYKDNGIPLIRIGNVGKGYFDAKNFVYLSKQTFNKFAEFQLKENDILMGMTGDLGKVCKIHKKYLPALLNQRVGRAIFKNNELNKNFVYYLFLSDQFQKKLDRYFIGAAQKNISSSQVENIKCLIPSLAEQKKIAEILSTVDEDIEKTDQIIQETEKLKRGLMQKLFTKGIGHKIFKKTKLGEIPEEWDIVTTEQILINKKGAMKIGPFGSQLKRSFFVEQGYKVYGQENIFVNNFKIGDRYIDKERYALLESCELKPGDFIISMMGTIGKCAIVPDNIEKGIMDSHLLRLQVDDKKYDKKFLLQIFKDSTLIQNQLISLAVGGIMAGLSSKVLKKLIFPKPTLKEQKQIAEILSEVDNKIEINKQIKNKLTQLKKGLMQDLLSGRVRVN